MFRRFLQGVYPLKEKTKKFDYNQFYCELCHGVFDEETLFDKESGKFLCQSCEKKVK
jgi:hypothetical protein